MNPDLTVATWLWGHRFTVAHVNILYRMVTRHLHVPFRFLLLTDFMREGLDEGIEQQIWQPMVSWGCWRRLRAFAPGMERIFGPRYFAIDLDVVITSDITPLVEADHEFAIYGNENPDWPNHLYSGTAWLLDTGRRAEVWERLKHEITRHPFLGDYHRVRDFLRERGLNGTDSAWISYVLGPGEVTWGPEDGVYSYYLNVEGRPGPPEDCRIVVLHGRTYDPMALTGEVPWIKEHYR